jgi:hypothetical protein
VIKSKLKLKPGEFTPGFFIIERLLFLLQVLITNATHAQIKMIVFLIVMNFMMNISVESLVR